MRVVRRVALGMRSDERRWGPVLGPTLVAYAIGAAIFRVMIVLGMCAVIATKFFVIGMVAALCYGGSVLLGTLVKTLNYLWASKETAEIRWRAATVGVLLLGLPALAVALPMPRSIYASGIVEREWRDAVNVPAPALLEAIAVHTGERVTAGEPIATLRSPAARDHLAVTIAERQAAEIELEVAEARDAAETSIARARLQAAREREADAQRQVDALVVRAPADGELTLLPMTEEPGRSFVAGTPIGTVESGARIATLVLDQHSFARLQAGEGSAIELRSHADPGRLLRGTIDSIAPAGSDQLASPALSVLGGGSIPVSPIDGRAENRYFEVRVRMEAADAAALPRGARIEARLPAERESLARRWYGAVVWFNEQLSAGR